MNTIPLPQGLNLPLKKLPCMACGKRRRVLNVDMGGFVLACQDCMMRPATHKLWAACRAPQCDAYYHTRIVMDNDARIYVHDFGLRQYYNLLRHLSRVFYPDLEGLRAVADELDPEGALTR